MNGAKLKNSGKQRTACAKRNFCFSKGKVTTAYGSKTHTH